MESKELNEALEVLGKDLEGKSKLEVKEAVEAFAVEQKAAIETMETTLKEDFNIKLAEVQDHANKLDMKLKESKKGVIDGAVDSIKSLIQDHFKAISLVRKGNAIKLESKDMTLATALTGDQTRVYRNTVEMIPSQLLNVADLIMSITISGGTYTFPRETAPTGAPDTQVEGSAKEQIEYAVSMIDCNTDFIAGFAVYSRKMANNLPFLESWLPQALRRDYWKAENSIFNVVLATDSTASTQVITGQNKIEMLIAEIATLEGIDYEANGIVVTPADYWDIMVTEVSTGAGYGLPGVVTLQNGQLRINGIPIFRANWVIANKYYVGDWNRVKKVNTQGLGVDFSNEDSDNFRKNNITARVESQTAICMEAPSSMIYGDFTAV